MSEELRRCWHCFQVSKPVSCNYVFAEQGIEFCRQFKMCSLCNKRIFITGDLKDLKLKQDFQQATQAKSNSKRAGFRMKLTHGLKVKLTSTGRLCNNLKGRVPERLNGADLKSDGLNSHGGSNPSSSAKFNLDKR